MRFLRVHAAMALMVVAFTSSEAGQTKETPETTTETEQTTTEIVQTTTKTEQTATEIVQPTTETVATTTEIAKSTAKTEQTTNETVQPTTETEQSTIETEQNTTETTQRTPDTVPTTTETVPTTTETVQPTTETEQTTTETTQRTTDTVPTTTETVQTTTETEQTTTETEQTTIDTMQTTAETVQTTTDSGVETTTNSSGSNGCCNDESLLPGTFSFFGQHYDYTTGATTAVIVLSNFDKNGILDPNFNVTCFSNQIPCLGCSFGDGSRRVCNKCKRRCPVSGYYTKRGTIEGNIPADVSFKLDPKGTVSPQQKVICVGGHFRFKNINRGCPTSGNFTYGAIRIDSETRARTHVTISYIFGAGGVVDVSQPVIMCPKS